MTNLKLTKLLNKTEEINQNLYSLDGYPIFDLMQASNEQGYITSTGYSFYCEIEDVNSKLASINNFLNVEKAKEFIKEQSQYILENHKIPTMTNQQVLAFNHLTSKDINRTFDKKIYGSAHLILDDKILIFFQNNPVINLNHLDLTQPENLQSYQNHLLHLYKNKMIKPDCEFTGIATQKIKNNIYKTSSKNIINLLLYLKEFFNEFNINANISIKDNKTTTLDIDGNVNTIKELSEGNFLFNEIEKNKSQIVEFLYENHVHNKFKKFLTNKGSYKI